MLITAMPIKPKRLIGIFYARCGIYAKACPHLKNGDKNEINCSQTRKIAQIISGYYLAL